MALIASDGLSLLVGDGGSPENFNILRGAIISRLEVAQRVANSNAVNGTGWQTSVAVSERRAVIECDALATDEAAAARLRSLSLSGTAGNIRIEISAANRIECAVYVMRYREATQPGEIKRITCTLESTGTVTVV